MEVFAEYYARHPFPIDLGTYVCTGPLGAKRLETLEWDLATLKEAADGKDAEELFMCFISPGWLQEFIWNDHYGSEEGFVLALGEAAKPYYRAIVEAGMVLQIDAPDIVDNWSWDRWTDVKAYRKNLEVRLEAIMNAISGLPEDRVRLHFCWGSWHGPHSIALPLEKVLDLVYRVPAQCYSVEAAKPNHTHEWRAFEEFPLPDGKIVMPGVIDHTTPIIEHPRVIADRIVAYAKVVGKENVIAGTDCGMRIDSRVEWTKLERMVQGAELATKELFE
jgi:5-methyltetrahydropteroyltriglutamate--homocysteine methyltransferase